MAKSNSNKSNFGLTLGFSGIQTIEGILVSYNETGVTFNSRKPGSSTMLNQFYPAARVVALVGDVGKESNLTVYSDYIPLFRNGKKGKERPIAVTGTEALGLHLISTTSDDHKVILVKNTLATFTGEEKDEDAPKRGRKASGEKTEKSDKKSKGDKKPKGKTQKGSDWP